MVLAEDMGIRILVLIVLTVALSAQERKDDKPKVLPEDRAADTYSVYEAALPKPLWSTTAHYGPKYYIVNHAIKPNSGWHPENCMHPPDDSQARVKEMLDDLSMQPDAYILEPRLKLDKPYQFVESGGHEVPPGEYGIALGIVSFSKDRSLASVVVWNSCGQLCGGSRWMVFTRGKKGWEEQPWSRCGAIF